MIRKLRWKIVGINLLFVAVILAALLGAIFLVTRASLVRGSEEQHRAALEGRTESFRPGQSGGQPCFVAELGIGGILRVRGSSYYELTDEAELLRIVEACLREKENAGVLPEYRLRYLREQTILGVRIAFTDSATEQKTLRSVLWTGAGLCAAALAVLALCSYLLSGVATKPVEKAWEEQRRFLSDASHELKTPLTVILSSAELLQQTLPPEGQEYAENITAEGHRMKKLVESMLTLSRVEDGPRMARTSVDLSDLTAAAALRFEPVAFEAGRLLRYEIEPGVRVSGCGERMEQLLGILVDNAVKYAPAGAEVRLTLRREGKHADLTVENPGEPIPPEKLAHLFERFYRLDAARSGPEGFGLGLAIAKAIAEEHGGTIRCESDAQSTRFTVTLPPE